MSTEKCRFCSKMNPPGSRFCNYCGKALAVSIQPDGLLPPGTELCSNIIESVIGEGGMGVVYRGHNKTLGTPCAIKQLDAKLSRMDILQKRFKKEADIQSHIMHPHIVRVTGFSDNDIPGVVAIIMELVNGEALDQLLERKGAMSERDAVSCALVMLDAIGTAHHANVVHRDLKPSNVMISAEEARESLYRGVKVMDFGIAKIQQENDQLTVTGAKMGTPKYMAPEQIENARDVDGRSDLYAIGLILYEMLCGHTPFEDYREFELMKAQLTMKPPSISTWRKDFSNRRLEAIVMKALEKHRKDRYLDAEEFQRALLGLGGYDDIPLKLHPLEGMPVQAASGNTELQKRIKQTINKAKPVDSADDIDKTLDKGSVETVQSAKRKKVNIKAHKNDLETTPKRLRSVEMLRMMQEESTSKPDPTQSKSPASAARLKAVPAPAVPASQQESAVKTVKAEKKKSESDKSVGTIKSSAVLYAQNASHLETHSETHSSEPSSVSVMVPSSITPKKSRTALNVVFVVLFLLAAAGLYYRYANHMPVPTAPDILTDDIAVQSGEEESGFIFREIQTKTGRMTVIPAGRHWISTGKRDELKQKTLDVFAMDQTEVSYFEYQKCVEAGKCPPLADLPSDLTRPVTNIGNGSAALFCEYAGKVLPTEDQWEAAARFGGETNGITFVNVSCHTVHFGAGRGECKKINENAPESVFYRVQSGNPGHLLNMLGNVREWTVTPSHSDPQKYITKGGSYKSKREDISIGAREEALANTGAPDLGFRCAAKVMKN